jgi:urease accessory protein
MDTRSSRRIGLMGLVAVGAAAWGPRAALAHTGVSAAHDLLHGVAHPLTGLDHICAMVAVGLWAAQLGGRAIWVVPLSFVTVMTLGGALGMAGIAMPLVEPGIVLSVLVLGVLVAAAVRLPMWASAAIVGCFALFHGHAHGTEAPASAAGLAYAAGFILATVGLHLSGIALGALVQRRFSTPVVRLAGAAIAACGVYLVVG